MSPPIFALAYWRSGIVTSGYDTTSTSPSRASKSIGGSCTGGSFGRSTRAPGPTLLGGRGPPRTLDLGSLPLISFSCS